MDYGNISEVVLGFKRVVDNIPSQYDNFDEALEKFFDAFHQTMDEMIPMKFYAYSLNGYGQEVDIFDTAEERDKWIKEIQELCGEEFEVCKAISPVEFLEVSYGEWDNPNCYTSDFDGMLAFVL